MLPRPPAALKPAFEPWPAGKPIFRCHAPRYEERAFNLSSRLARFRPFMHDGEIVPTAYGADDLAGAVSETVFHDVPVRGPNRRILRSEIEQWVWCELAATRELTLVKLHGTGLTRLQVTHGELIESDARHYAETAPWAKALHDADPVIDGLCWRSRQHNDSLALILFGTRVRDDDLRIVRPAESLSLKPGGDVVYEFAEAADITIVA
jgi:RES domain-containing protein